MDITGVKFEKERISEGFYRVGVRVEEETVVEKYYVGADFDAYDFVLRPVPTDLPILLNFSGAYVLPEKTMQRLYSPIPVEYNAVLSSGGRDEIEIGRVHLWDRKRMYYGKPNDGEFAYFYESGITKSPVTRKDIAYLAMDIENKDKDEWILKKLLIDYNQLSLFLKDGVIYTELVKITIEDGNMELEYTDEPPYKEAELILEGLENSKKLGIYRLGKRKLKGLLF